MTEENQGINVISLMRAAVNLIDTVSTRGAFRGEELLDVGMIRGQLAKAADEFESFAREQQSEAPQATIEGDFKVDTDEKVAETV